MREQRLFLAPGSGRGDDRDGHDADPATIHVIGLAGDDIHGTVRLYPLATPGLWQGDRLAVLPEFRHLGLGAPLVRFAVAAAGRRGGHLMEAQIQPGNVPFFEWLGWQRAGGLAPYAGILHQRMVIDLTAVPRLRCPAAPLPGAPGRPGQAVPRRPAGAGAARPVTDSRLRSNATPD